MKIKTPGFRIGRSFDAAFSPDTDHLAVVGRDVVLWNIRTRQRLRSSRMLKNPSSVAFSPSGATFAVKNTAGELLIAETATADPIARFVPAKSDEGPGPIYLSEDSIVDASWNGEIRLRTVSSATTQHLWSDERVMIRDINANASHLAFSLGAKHYETHAPTDARRDELLLVERTDLKTFAKVASDWKSLEAVALSPEGDRAVVRHRDQQRYVEIVNLNDGRIVANAASEIGGTGQALTWSPDGTTVVLVERKGFSFRSASDLMEFGWLPSEYPAAIAFSTKGEFVALGDWQHGVVSPWSAVLNDLVRRQ